MADFKVLRKIWKCELLIVDALGLVGLWGWPLLICHHTGVREKDEDEGTADRSCHGLTTAFKSVANTSFSILFFLLPLLWRHKESKQAAGWFGSQIKWPHHQIDVLGILYVPYVHDNEIVFLLFYYCASVISNHPNDMESFAYGLGWLREKEGFSVKSSWDNYYICENVNT